MVGETNRRTFVKGTSAAAIAGLFGVTGAASKQDQRLSWHAGGTGGTYFPLSNEFKTIIDENTDFTVQVQSTGASVENVGSLARGDANFALIQNDIASFAYNGEGLEEFEGNAVPSLRGVASLYPETIHVLTLADTGIETIEDLEGATINTGDLGSGTQVDAQLILDAVGISDFSEQNTGFSQAADQLRNGDIDAAFIVGGWPVGAVEELATTQDITIVEISGDAREEIMDQNDFFAEDEIPEGTYNGVDEAVQTVAVQAMIATTEGESAETVEAVTRAIFENTDQLSIKADFISEDTALDGMSIPLHSGAEAVFGPLEEAEGTPDGGETGTPGTETEDGMTTEVGTETDDGMTTEVGTETDDGMTTEVGTETEG